MTTHPAEPAFARAGSDTNYDAVGLTKREHMATQVLSGLVSLPVAGAHGHADLAEKAVRIADALIVALNRPDADVEI